MNRDLPIKIELPEEFFKDETICGEFIPTKKKELWAVELDLYEKLWSVCSKYSLTLLADSGTALGAVRHHGFIPWDDDIDLMMPRADYEKLCNVAKDEFEFPYFWSTEDTEIGTSRGHAQLRNSNTTGYVPQELAYGKKINKGIFIDIFPYDNVPDDEEERRKYLLYIYSLQRKARRYKDCYYGINNSVGIKRILKSFLILAIKVFHKTYHNRYYYKLKKAKRHYNSINTKLIANLFLVRENNLDKLVYPKEIFGSGIDMKFETISIKVPVDYDHYLSYTYGDYKTFKRSPSTHGGIVYDPHTPYGKMP